MGPQRGSSQKQEGESLSRSGQETAPFHAAPRRRGNPPLPRGRQSLASGSKRQEKNSYEPLTSIVSNRATLFTCRGAFRQSPARGPAARNLYIIKQHICTPVGSG